MPLIPMNDLRNRLSTEAMKQQVDPALVHAITFGGEGSTGDPTAKSPAGAQGIMQLMPDTATALGVQDAFNPDQNIAGGVKLIKQLSQAFPGRNDLIAAGYHAGEGAVRRAGMQVPNTGDVNMSTQSYVNNVLAAYKRETMVGGVPQVSIFASKLPESPSPVSQAAIAARDPRQPIIDLGLKLMGKTRDDMKQLLSDPNGVDHFFSLTLQQAAQANSTLNALSSLGDYSTQLTKMIADENAQKTQGPPPPTPEKAPSATQGMLNLVPEGAKALKGVWYSPKEGADIGVQVARGLTTDWATGLVRTGEDVGRVFYKTVGEILHGLAIPVGPWSRSTEKVLNQAGDYVSSAADVVGVGKTMIETAEHVFGHPQTFTSNITRSLAGFIVPFNALTKTLGASGAAVGTMTAFVDPDEGTTIEMLTKFAQSYAPDNWQETLSAITRYISRESTESELVKRMQGRALRGIDAALFEGALQVWRFLRAGHEAKAAMQAEVPGPPLEAVPAKAGGIPANIEVGKGPVVPPSRPSTPGAQGELFPGRTPLSETPPTQLGLFEDISKARVIGFRVQQAEQLAKRLGENPSNADTLADVQMWMKMTEGSTDPAITARRAQFLKDVPGTDLVPQPVPVRTPGGLPETAPAVEAPLVTSEAAPKALPSTPAPLQAGLDEAQVIMDALDKPPSATRFPTEVRNQLESVLDAVTNPSTETVALPEAVNTLLNLPPLTARLSNPVRAALTSLLDQATDPVNQKVILASMLRGGVSYLVADQLFPAEKAEAADGTTVDQSTMQMAKIIFAVAVATGVGGWTLVQAIKQAKALRAAANPDLVEGALPKFAPNFRATGPAARLIRDLPADAPLTPSTVIVNGAKKDIPLFNIRDPQDLAELKANTMQLFPNADATKKALGSVPFEDSMAMAREHGLDSNYVRRVQQNSTDPLHYSQEMATIVTLNQASQQTIISLRDRFIAGETGVGDELLRQLAIGGEIGRGLITGSSDFGRGLNILRQASDGLVERAGMLGEMAGSVVKTPEDMFSLVEKLRLLDAPGITRAANALTAPSGKRALIEAIFNSYLMVPAGAVNQVIQNTGRIFAEMMIRENAAWAMNARRLFGYEVQEDTPAIGEGAVMLWSVIQSSLKALAVGARFVKTGVLENIEPGSERVMTTAMSPQFVRGAFPRTAAGLDAVGSLAGFEHAGDLIDVAGTWMRMAGTRLRLAADEAAQFQIGEMESNALAYRAASQETFANSAERTAYLADFKLNPPQGAVDEIARQKRVVTFMNDLADPRGGFQKFREWANFSNRISVDSPFMRVNNAFIRAHANLLTFTGEITPGLNVALSPSFRQALSNPDPVIRGEAVGRMWLGLQVMGAAAGLGAAGYITGPGSTDPAMKEQMARAGRQPNSLHFDVPFMGQMSWKLNPGEPLGFLLMTGGGLGATAGGATKPEEMNLATVALSTASDLLAQTPIVDAIGQIWDALDKHRLDTGVRLHGGGEVTLETLDTVLLRNVLPPLLWQKLVKVVEPYKQVHDDYFQKVENRSWNTNAPLETDSMGRPRWTGGGHDPSQMNNFMRLFFPFDLDPVITDPLDKAMNDKGVVMHDPRKNIGTGPIDVPLTNTEHQRFKDIMAKPDPNQPSLYEALSSLTQTEFWKTATPGRDGTAHLAVSQVWRAYSNTARGIFLAKPENAHVLQRIEDKAKANGFDTNSFQVQ